jgi:uncharacterized membrane protein
MKLMRKALKRIVGIVLALIGIAMFVSLYVIVIINKADYVKYIVTVLGYICVIVFTIGIMMFKSTLSPKEEKLQEKLK